MVMGCYYVEDIYPKLAIDVGLMLIPGEMVMMMVLRVAELQKIQISAKISVIYLFESPWISS